MRRTLFDEEHDAFRESVAALLDKELAPHAAAHRAAGAIDRALWETLGAHGFLGFMAPVELGGGGVDDFRFNVVLDEELARYGVAYASSFGINVDVVAPYLLELTTPAQRERWLPRFCAGELITAIGMTEPSAGSDLAGIRTAAVRTGDSWVLNGSKTFITNGHRADLVLVAARTSDGPRAITLFAVEAGMPGFSRSCPLDKVGQPEADTAELFFDDVVVPGTNVIGEVGGGFRHMMERLPQERLSVAVTALAHARAVLETTLAYVRERHAFGQPIGRFQHNAFVLADLHAALDVAQAHVDACVAARLEGALDAVDAATAKLVATELQGRVVDAAVQLHGGYGYMRESEVARAWTDARVTRIWGGTSEIMREVIGRSLRL